MLENSLELGRAPKDEDQPPFVVGVVGDFGGINFKLSLKPARFVKVNLQNFDVFFANCGPRIADLPEVGIRRQRRFANFGDFTPEGLSRIVANNLPNSATAAEVDRIWNENNLEQIRASWSGLKFAVESTASLPNVKIAVLDSSKKRTARDLERAPEFDQSALFMKIYEEEMGTLGGEPFGCLLFDYTMSRTADDIALMEKLTSIASAARAPALLEMGPSFFDVQPWTDLKPAAFPPDTPSDPLHTKWAAMRASDDADFCFAFLPRMLFLAGKPCWIDPSYWVAVVAAHSLRGESLPAAAERLFDDRDDSPIPPSELSFNFDCDQQLANALKLAGINAFNRNTKSNLILHSILSLSESRVEHPPQSLATALLHGQAWTRLNAFVRQKAHQTAGQSIHGVVQEWMEGLVPANESDRIKWFFQVVESEDGRRLQLKLSRPDKLGQEQTIFETSLRIPHHLRS